MQNRKKNLWLIALVGALTIAFAGGCPDDDSGKDKDKDKDKKGQEYDNKTLTYQEIKALSETDTYKDKKIDMVAISGDRKTAYVVNNAKANLRVLKNDDAKVESTITDKANWVDVALKGASTNGAGANVSKFDLASVATVNTLVSYGSGAVLTTAGGSTPTSNGLILMKHDVKEKTYSTNNLNSIVAHGGGNAGGAGFLGMAVVAKDNGGLEQLVAINRATGHGALVALTADTVITGDVGGGAPGTAAAPVAFAGNDDINFVARAGGVIDRLPKTAVVHASNWVAGAGTDYIHTVAGNKWNHVAGTANDQGITALALHGTNLYVGLKGAADKGGVVIISSVAAGAGTAVKPDAATKGKTIHAFAVRKNGEVYGISDEDIFVFKDDKTKPEATYNKAAVGGAKGDIADGTAKAGWLGDLSMKKMNSAAWLSDDILLVGDAEDGLATINFKSDKSVKVKKQ